MTDSVIHPDQRIDLWLFDIRQANPELFVAAESMMSAHEKARAQKMIRGKQEFIASRWLTRRVLADYTATAPDKLVFEYSSKGKPALTRSNIGFSLSHSGHWALLAVSTLAWMGVDIECNRATRDLPGIAQSFFHPDEFRQLDAMPENEQADYFYKLWTLKEAFLKALGTGISAGLEKIHFSFAGDIISATIAPDLDTGTASANASSWHFYHHNHEPGVQVALAYQAKNPVEARWFNVLDLVPD